MPTGMYCGALGTMPVRGAGASAGRAAGGVGADLRGNGVGIDAEEAVIAERSDVGHAQRRVAS